MQDRIIWLDNLKAFGILAVILGHIATPLGFFIYSWHMPLFFFLAGLLIKHELTTKQFILKDFKRLMLPYFVFALVALILETVKRIILNRDGLNYVDEIKGIFIWMDYGSLINTYGFVLWFLPALFFARILVFFLNKFTKTFLIKTAIIIFLFYLSFNLNIIFAIDNALNAVVFVFIGSVYFRLVENDRWLGAFPFLLLGLIYSLGIPGLDLSSKYYENVPINILYSISIIFTFILIIKKINYENKLLSLWGSNTMLLFVIHPYTNNIGHIIVEKIHFGDWYLKFFISLFILQGVLIIKKKYIGRGIFNYV